MSRLSFPFLLCHHFQHLWLTNKGKQYEEERIQQGSDLLCQGCCNKVPQREGLKQRKFIVSQLWREKSESRCWQAHLPLKPLDKASPDPFPASGGPLACGSITPIFTCRPPCVHVSVQISSLYIDTSHIGLEPTLHQYDPIVTNYSCHDPTSQ